MKVRACALARPDVLCAREDMTWSSTFERQSLRCEYIVVCGADFVVTQPFVPDSTRRPPQHSFDLIGMVIGEPGSETQARSTVISVVGLMPGVAVHG